MHSVGIDRSIPSDGPEEYTMKMLICPLVFGRWIVADEVKEGGEDLDSMRILMIRL